MSDYGCGVNLGFRLARERAEAICEGMVIAMKVGGSELSESARITGENVAKWLLHEIRSMKKT